MDSDDEREEIASWRGVRGTVVLINVDHHDTATVGQVATCRMVRQILRNSNSENIAVCVYGIEEANTSAFGSRNVIDIIPLCTPSLDDYKKLKNFKISALKPAKELKLSEALWHCSKLFSNCKKTLAKKSVIMLTRLDKPPEKLDQNPALIKVNDLIDSNIHITIINLAKVEYKVDPFFINFLIEVNRSNDYVVPAPIYDPKEIEALLHRHSHRHLAVANLSFDIGSGLSIGVGVYNLLMKQSTNPYKSVNLDRETNNILTSVTKTMKVSIKNDTDPMDVDDPPSEQTKEVPVLNTELLYYVNYGGERVEFTSQEKKKLSNPFGPPMMKLLGFKPTSIMCKEKWFFKPGSFLFPSESVIEGSTVAFKALHKACVDTRTQGICVLVSTHAKPKIVGLVPCTHPLGLDVEVGFEIIPIPFIEHVRDIPNIQEEETNITREQKSFMKDVVEKLKFDYKTDMFENPKLQSQYTAIEAIALEDDDVEPFIDTTKPSSEMFQDIPDDVFEELFGPFNQVATKRPAAVKNIKPVKKPRLDGTVDEILLQDRITSGSVHKYNVPELKELLKSKADASIPALTGLKKNQLVDLVYKYFS